MSSEERHQDYTQINQYTAPQPIWNTEASYTSTDAVSNLRLSFTQSCAVALEGAKLKQNDPLIFLTDLDFNPKSLREHMYCAKYALIKAFDSKLSKLFNNLKVYKTGVLAVITTNDHHVFFLQRKSGLYSSPGGFLDPEDLRHASPYITAALRESEEELTIGDCERAPLNIMLPSLRSSVSGGMATLEFVVPIRYDCDAATMRQYITNNEAEDSGEHTGKFIELDYTQSVATLSATLRKWFVANTIPGWFLIKPALETIAHLPQGQNLRQAIYNVGLGNLGSAAPAGEISSIL